MLVAGPGNPCSDLRQRIVPSDGLELSRPARARAAHRLLDPVGAVHPRGKTQTAYARAGVARIRVVSGLHLHKSTVADCALQERPTAAVVRTARVHDPLVRHLDSLLSPAA